MRRGSMSEAVEMWSSLPARPADAAWHFNLTRSKGEDAGGHARHDLERGRRAKEGSPERDVDAISYSARSKARRSKKKAEKRLDSFRETKWLALRSRLKIVST